ncbi:hypothetical protein PM082_010135 [Marasmius tenuissimus]|nr:hypothetical protein PM082_010135 [Marasmius tenuissimus]
MAESGAAVDVKMDNDWTFNPSTTDHVVDEDQDEEMETEMSEAEDKDKEEDKDADDVEPHTLDLKQWSDLQSSYPSIVQQVLDHSQEGLQAGYLVVQCEESWDRAWAQIVSDSCVRFIKEFQGTSVVPELYHTTTLEDDMSVVVTVHPGSPMKVPGFNNEHIPLQLASQLLQHMVTLVGRGYLWIVLDSDDMFFDINSVEVKLFNVQISAGRSADCSILHVAGHLLQSLFTSKSGNGSLLEKLCQELLENATMEEGNLMSDNDIFTRDVRQVFQNACKSIDSRLSCFGNRPVEL